MNLQVNGKPMELEEGASVQALLEAMHLGAKRVAVEVNRELVVKTEWAEKVLHEGDRVEVVSFVGGG